MDNQRQRIVCATFITINAPVLQPAFGADCYEDHALSQCKKETMWLHHDDNSPFVHIPFAVFTEYSMNFARKKTSRYTYYILGNDFKFIREFLTSDIDLF
jgi:hypothetical protein